MEKNFRFYLLVILLGLILSGCQMLPVFQITPVPLETETPQLSLNQITDIPTLPPVTATPTPSPTPKPTRTPDIARDYGKFDYRLAGLMPDKYQGSRYRLTGVLLSVLDTEQFWLVQLGDGGLAAVRGAGAQRSAGATVNVWGEYAGLTGYQSESGPVTLPLFNCEHLE